MSSLNVEVPSYNLEIYKPNTVFNMEISGLIPESTYELYIVGGSFHPDYPDLMDA